MPDDAGNADEVIDRAGSDDLLELAVDRGSVPWQVGALLVLDRPVDPADVRRALDERVRAVPRLRRTLVRTPPLCGRPIWVDDPGFSAGDHVREVTCPGPADDDAPLENALLDVAMQAVGSRVSLEHPPWEAVVVTGVPGGRGALVIVFHHVLANGIAGLAALAQLVDGAPPAPSDRGFPRRRPTPQALAVDATRRRAAALAHLPRGLRQVRDAVRELRLTRAPRAPRVSLNRPTGSRRVLRAVRTDLAAVRDAAHRHGGTVNDVVLATVGGALGALLARRGETASEVVASVPISARSARAPTGWATPSVSSRWPSRPRVRSRPGSPTASAPLLDAGFRLVAATGALPWLLDHQRLVTTFVTNLRGPSSPIAFLGARVVDVVPVTTTTGNVPVVFGAFSYDGVLTITVVADPDACPEVEAIVDDLRADLDAVRSPRDSTSTLSRSGPVVVRDDREAPA